MGSEARVALGAGLLAGLLAQPVLVGVYPHAAWWMHAALFMLSLLAPPAFMAFARRIGAGRKVSRFVIVGGLTTFVDLGILDILLLALAHGDAHARMFPAFATISFIAATLNSFAWHRAWTFGKQGTGLAADLSRFYAVTLASFVVNVGLSTLLVWLQPFPFLGQTLWANIAKVLATGVSLLLNFMGYDRLVFRKP